MNGLNVRQIIVFIIIVASALAAACAQRDPLKPLESADVRLLGKPRLFSATTDTTEALACLGEVKNFGDRMAYNVKVRVAFSGGHLSGAGLGTYDGNLRPGENCPFEVVYEEISVVGTRIDFVELLWEDYQADGDSLVRKSSGKYVYFD